MNVHAGPQQRVNLILAQLHSFHLIKLFHQLRIKGAGKQCAVWQGKGDGSAVHADSGGSIRAARNRDSKCL